MAGKKKIPAEGSVLCEGRIRSVETHGIISRLFVEAPQISSKAQPGQFVHVKSPAADQLLRVPISIADAGEDQIELMVKRVGAGTEALGRVKKDDTVNLLGPLGTPFSLPQSSQEAVLVGGGVGIAPMLFLSKQFSSRQIPHLLIWGARSSDEIYLKDRPETLYTTEDGSFGVKGRVTDLLGEKLSNNRIVYTCGPTPMMKAVAKMARSAGCLCYVSLEEWMGCGIGACLGCAVSTVRGIERVCAEGPVFNAEDLLEYA